MSAPNEPTERKSFTDRLRDSAKGFFNKVSGGRLFASSVADNLSASQAENQQGAAGGNGPDNASNPNFDDRMDIPNFDDRMDIDSVGGKEVHKNDKGELVFKDDGKPAFEQNNPSNEHNYANAQDLANRLNNYDTGSLSDSREQLHPFTYTSTYDASMIEQPLPLTPDNLEAAAQRPLPPTPPGYDSILKGNPLSAEDNYAKTPNTEPKPEKSETNSTMPSPPTAMATELKTTSALGPKDEVQVKVENKLPPKGQYGDLSQFQEISKNASGYGQLPEGNPEGNLQTPEQKAATAAQSNIQSKNSVRDSMMATGVASNGPPSNGQPLSPSAGQSAGKAPTTGMSKL